MIKKQWKAFRELFLIFPRQLESFTNGKGGLCHEHFFCVTDVSQESRARQRQKTMCFKASTNVPAVKQDGFHL